MSFTNINDILPKVFNKHSLSEGINSEMILREVDDYFFNNKMKNCTALSIKKGKMIIRVSNSQQSSDLFFLKGEILSLCDSIHQSFVKEIYFKKV